jgi:hypothetical protein
MVRGFVEGLGGECHLEALVVGKDRRSSCL